MSITTRVGDQQTTFLLSGEEVPKDALRLETYGTLDELVAHLGFAKSLLPKDSVVAVQLRALQLDLFRVGAELASASPSSFVDPTTNKQVQWLEHHMQAIESRCSLPASFLIPGTCPASAALEVARTVARRLERRVIELAHRGEYNNTQGMVYCNRLSDYCFLLARAAEQELGVAMDPKDASS